jgi:hypothetical protein
VKNGLTIPCVFPNLSTWQKKNSLKNIALLLEYFSKIKDTWQVFSAYNNLFEMKLLITVQTQLEQQ